MINRIGENKMKILKKLFRKKIIWREVTPNGVEFIADINGEICKLRINDFPDEPFFTLTYKEMQFDFDDEPKTWEIPSFNK